MGGLAHYFESCGLATTQISLIRQHSEQIKPPRALWVPFELGRPLGVPGDPGFQARVLVSALTTQISVSLPVRGLRILNRVHLSCHPTIGSDEVVLRRCPAS